MMWVLARRHFGVIKTISFQRNQIGWYPFMLQEHLNQEIITSWNQIILDALSRSWIRTEMLWRTG